MDFVPAPPLPSPDSFAECTTYAWLAHGPPHARAACVLAVEPDRVRALIRLEDIPYFSTAGVGVFWVPKDQLDPVLVGAPVTVAVGGDGKIVVSEGVRARLLEALSDGTSRIQVDGGRCRASPGAIAELTVPSGQLAWTWPRADIACTALADARANIGILGPVTIRSQDSDGGESVAVIPTSAFAVQKTVAGEWSQVTLLDGNLEVSGWVPLASTLPVAKTLIRVATGRSYAGLISPQYWILPGAQVLVGKNGLAYATLTQEAPVSGERKGRWFHLDHPRLFASAWVACESVAVRDPLASTWEEGNRQPLCRDWLPGPGPD